MCLFYLQLGRLQLSENQRFLDVMVDSYLFGTIFVLMWLTLTATFIRGRKKYSQVLKEIETVLLDMKALMQKLDAGCMTRLRRHLVALFLLIAIVVVPFFVFCVLEAQGDRLTTDPLQKVMLNAGSMAYNMLMLSFLMTPIKFIFAGFLISTGFQTCNALLRTVSDQRAGTLKEGSILRGLGLFRLRLTLCFDALTSAMLSELVLSMFYGVCLDVLVLLMLMGMFESGDIDFMRVMFISMALLRVFITFVGPCETTQRLMILVGEGQDLLVHVQLQQPQLESEVAALMAVGQRALDTLGDLGLYRLSRSTFLAINSTVITYLIVMQQFRVSGLTRGQQGNHGLYSVPNITETEM